MTSKTLLDGLIFPESLRQHDGHYWCVDMYDGKVLSIDGSGAVDVVFATDSILGGLGWLPNGDLLVVDKRARKVLNLASGRPVVHADLSQSGTSRLNDMIVLEDGFCLVGEYGFDQLANESFKKASIYAISPDGDVTIAASELSFPNGMARCAHANSLVVAQSMGRKLSRFELGPGGQLLSRNDFCRFDAGYPDGISLDSADNVWAALVGQNAVACVGPDGRVVRRIDLETQPYDVLCGARDDTLIIAVSNAQSADLLLDEIPRTGSVIQIEI